MFYVRHVLTTNKLKDVEERKKRGHCLKGYTTTNGSTYRLHVHLEELGLAGQRLIAKAAGEVVRTPGLVQRANNCEHRRGTRSEHIEHGPVNKERRLRAK